VRRASADDRHALILVFMAAMIGFCLSGDLFNLFVLLELMGALAYAPTGYKFEETGSLQGALNFGVITSIGAFLALIGTTMVYGRTGALTLAEMERALERQLPDALVGFTWEDAAS
jgi:multicomponent Na+:H+ antiporter subunit D